MWILTHSFFAETFQPMNAAVTFQICLNDSTRAIRGKCTFAGAWESFQGIRTIYSRKKTQFNAMMVFLIYGINTTLSYMISSMQN